jgi:hypothetical protein
MLSLSREANGPGGAGGKVTLTDSVTGHSATLGDWPGDAAPDPVIVAAWIKANAALVPPDKEDKSHPGFSIPSA